MQGSQKIVYANALDRLRGIKEKHRVVSGKALFPESEKYKDWAKNSDEVYKDLDFCFDMFNMLFKEITTK